MFYDGVILGPFTRRKTPCTYDIFWVTRRMLYSKIEHAYLVPSITSVACICTSRVKVHVVVVAGFKYCVVIAESHSKSTKCNCSCKVPL